MINKYGARKNEYNGLLYDSGGEAALARDLEMLKHAKELKDIERQVRIPLDVNGHHICNVVIDFRITRNDGEKELVEYKGFLTAEANLKYKLLSATYLHENPDVGFTIVYRSKVEIRQRGNGKPLFSAR